MIFSKYAWLWHYLVIEPSLTTNNGRDINMKMKIIMLTKVHSTLHDPSLLQISVSNFFNPNWLSTIPLAYHKLKVKSKLNLWKLACWSFNTLNKGIKLFSNRCVYSIKTLQPWRYKSIAAFVWVRVEHIMKDSGLIPKTF